MTQPHATRADIEAILKARRDTISQVQAIPTLPPAQAQVAPTSPTQPNVTAQGMTATTPTAAAHTPVSDADLSAFLEKHLPQIQAKAVALATPPFVWTEVLELGQVVSQAVSDGLPLAKDGEAAKIVQVVTGYAYDHYLVPALPASIKPFTGLLRPLVLGGIEAAYQLAVKRKLSK